MLKIKELLINFDPGMSNYQKDNFVTLKNGVTIYGKYKQALRELHGRVESVEQMIFAMKKQKLVVKKARWHSDNSQWLPLLKGMKEVDRDHYKVSEYINNRIDMHELKFEEAQFSYDKMKLRVPVQIEDLLRFYSQAIVLHDMILTEYTCSLISKELQEKLEKEEWYIRTKLLATTDIEYNKMITPATIEQIESLDRSSCKEIYDFLDSRSSCNEVTLSLKWKSDYHDYNDLIFKGFDTKVEAVLCKLSDIKTIEDLKQIGFATDNGLRLE